MRSLQDYRNIYREIAQSLGYRGDSVELLVQLLANATYIEEVENITYMQEASLERATLMNSKIQHCVNNMYSVFRGSCPRVLFHVRPTKYQVFKPYQEIASSSNFKVYYLGSISEADMATLMDDFKKGLLETKDFMGISEGIRNNILTVNPILPDTYYIYGFIAESVVQKEYTISEDNKYYFDIPETGLSNDMYVEVAKSGQNVGDLENWRNFQVTRIFSEHVLGKMNPQSEELEEAVYDLTIPGFGSRLYFPESLELSDKIRATYYKLSYLDSFQENELRRISLKGMDIVPLSFDFLETHNILFENIYPKQDKIYSEEDGKDNGGLIIIPETPREELQSIHYNASRDRFINSIVRSNTDMGRLLEQMYPENVRTNGTACSYKNKNVVIWYIPRNGSNLLNADQVLEFTKKHQAYYISSRIEVRKAQEIEKVLTIDIELYRTANNLETKVEEIINPYQYRFGVNLFNASEEDSNNEVINEIISTLSKIPEVRLIKDIGVRSISDDGDLVEERCIEDGTPFYYSIRVVINSSITR